jgi:hypothetical protein
MKRERGPFYRPRDYGIRKEGFRRKVYWVVLCGDGKNKENGI